jgi:hypothetical protein
LLVVLNACSLVEQTLWLLLALKEMHLMTWWAAA